MKIVIGSDPSGFELKEKIKKYLADGGYEVMDVGTLAPEAPVLYYDVAANASKAIQKGEAEKGIVICGNGLGVGIVSNKHKGIHCAPVESVWASKQARMINNVNMVAMGARAVGEGVAMDIVDAFLNTEFLQGVLPQRKEFVTGLFNSAVAIENENFK